jgi:hypothetical protein
LEDGLVYVIGALKNPEIPKVAKLFREEGFEVYDEWFCPGPDADTYWQAYCRNRGLSYSEALDGWHAKQVFEIDKFHLDRCSAAVLVLPAGKSGHMEIGYACGTGKRTFILLDKEPDRYDLMYRFVEKATSDVTEIIERLRG